ncbi:MAG: class I SAM-dependent methyltransferase, partial [Desulfosalsimonadaceae bacterium]
MVDETMLASVKGFLDRDEGMRLYEAAKSAGRMGPCLEIGSYCGKSSLYLGWGCRESNSVVFSVDHHRGSEEQQPGEGFFDPDTYDPRVQMIDTLPLFRQTLAKAGLQDTVLPMVGRSAVFAKFWSIPLALVFIDGGHSYAAAVGDYSGWAGHIMPGGLLLIHDIFESPDQGG